MVILLQPPQTNIKSTDRICTSIDPQTTTTTPKQAK